MMDLEHALAWTCDGLRKLLKKMKVWNIVEATVRGVPP